MSEGLTGLACSRRRPIAPPEGKDLFEFWSNFGISTLARVNLSFLPFYEMLERKGVRGGRVASFGSGSCTHEVALALAFPETSVQCYDYTDEYIPAHTAAYIEGSPRLRFDLYDFSRPPESTFDLVFSIQTLEHIDDFESALDLLVSAVGEGGHLYVDTPLFHEHPEREREYESIKKRHAEVYRHYHVGFSRRLMEQRLQQRGLKIVDSGYYSYVHGDAHVMQAARTIKVKADSASTHLMNVALLSALTASEDFYRDKREEIDDLLQANRVCHAYRILAKRPGASVRE